jgi:glyoxylase-like metal-dependent hydrolase (beta-lactamase superfamily II)
VVLTQVGPEPAHTHGDLWVELPRHRVIATGDVLFHTYYPFLDTDEERGASLPGMVSVLRAWAAERPDATFLPGHGPLARAADLRRYADYLETLWQGARAGRREGRTPPDAALAAQLRGFDLGILPSFHNTLLPIWATAARNVGDAYALAAAAGGQP